MVLINKGCPIPTTFGGTFRDIRTSAYRAMIFEQPFDTTFMTTFFFSLFIGQK